MSQMRPAGPRAARSGTADRLSTTCRTATSAGSVIEVRLIAAFQASRSRAWVASAARATSSSESPSSARPRSSARSYSGGRGGRSSTRVGSGARRRPWPPRGTPAVGSPLPAWSFNAAWAFGLARLVQFAVGFPRTPREPRAPRLFPVRMPDIATASTERQPGYPREWTVRVRSWITARGGSSPVDTAARAEPARDRGTSTPGRTPDGAAQRPPDDIDDLVDVALRVAALVRGPDAALDVVLEDEDRQRVDGRPERARLLEDVDAVLVALDHPGDATDLALDSGKAPDELGLVARVRVPEGVGRGCGSRDGHPRMILPGGIRDNLVVRSRPIVRTGTLASDGSTGSPPRAPRRRHLHRLRGSRPRRSDPGRCPPRGPRVPPDRLPGVPEHDARLRPGRHRSG